MLKIIRFVIVAVVAVLFIGCGGSSTDRDSSFHFQGRDCLSCHNYDLKPDKHLSIAGTLYKSADVIDAEENLVDKKIYVQLLDRDKNVIIDTSTDKKGSFFATGNFFVLAKEQGDINGDYLVRLIDENGNVLAFSSSFHSFSSNFDKDSPDDTNNRYSCNSCHTIPAKGGTIGRLYQR